MKRGVLMTMCLVSLTASGALAQTETSQVYKPGSGVSMPKIVKEVKPVYPPDAMSAGIEGSVMLEGIVNTDGSVSDVRVTKPLYAPLDEAAIAALRKWRFVPGTRDGKAVRVLVEFELTFTMRRREPSLDSPGVYKPGDGVLIPTVVREIKPSYTRGAMDARIEGTVTIDCVILTDGTVGDLRVSKALDPGLDAEAVKAIRKWKFQPGTKDGKPVPVQVFVEMTFTLK